MCSHVQSIYAIIVIKYVAFPKSNLERQKRGTMHNRISETSVIFIILIQSSSRIVSVSCMKHRYAERLWQDTGPLGSSYHWQHTAVADGPARRCVNVSKRKLLYSINILQKASLIFFKYEICVHHLLTINRNEISR